MSQHDVFSRTSQFTYGTSFIIHLHCWTDTRTYSFTSGYIGVSTNFYKKSMSGCAQFTNGFSHRRWWHGLTTPLFLTFCLQIYFQQNFFISLLFHLFFLILTCSCQYSCNLMLTSNCMCRY